MPEDNQENLQLLTKNNVECKRLFFFAYKQACFKLLTGFKSSINSSVLPRFFCARGEWIQWPALTEITTLNLLLLYCNKFTLFECKNLHLFFH